MQKPPHIFLRKNCVKVSPEFAAGFQITSTNWSVYPIAENFPFFLQVVEVFWETTANRGETLTQSCAEKIWGFFALYRMKFYLVLRKLWMIWLIQEILGPNHADHVIGHLDVWYNYEPRHVISNIGILTSVDSDEPVQLTFKARNS